MRYKGMIWDGAEPSYSVQDFNLDKWWHFLSQEEASAQFGPETRALLSRLRLVDGYQWDYNHHGGVNVSVQDTSPPTGSGTILASETLVSSRNEKFSERVKAGEIIMSPFDRYRSILTQEPGLELVEGGAIYDAGFRSFAQNTGIKVKNNRQSGGFSFNRISGTFELHYIYDLDGLKRQYGEPVLDMSLAAKDSRMITATVAEANSGVYDLLTELAELPETVKYMFGLVTDAAKAAKATKSKEVEILRLAKRKGMTAIQVADAIASVWMQFRYAISPIVYSLEDIQKMLEELNRVFARYRGRLIENDTITDHPFWDEMSIETVHRCCIKRSYSPEHLVSALLQVLKLNPVTTAWELVPLSFVVDWFLNIGDLLAALTGPNHEYIQSVGSYSTKFVVKCTKKDSHTGASVSYTGERYIREIIDPSAYVGLTAAIDMNLFRTLDSLALGWFATRGSLLDLEYKIFKSTKSSRR